MPAAMLGGGSQIECDEAAALIWAAQQASNRVGSLSFASRASIAGSDAQNTSSHWRLNALQVWSSRL